MRFVPPAILLAALAVMPAAEVDPTPADDAGSTPGFMPADPPPVVGTPVIVDLPHVDPTPVAITDTADTGSAAFLREALIAGRYEVRAARLVLAAGVPSTTGSLADQVIADHTAANQELERFAAREGFALPLGLDPERQAMIDRLTALEDEALDREYRRQLMQAHRADIALFAQAAQDLHDPALRRWARERQATLERRVASIEGRQGR